MTTEMQNSLIADEDTIRSAIEKSPACADQQIHVKVDDGCVVLTGTVTSWAAHQNATRVSLSTPGVRAVDNQLALLVKARPSTR